jgi:capsular polysaccharide biosynthesis protein
VPRRGPVYVEPVTRVLADWRFWVALVGTAVAFGVAAIVSGTVDRSWRAETTIIVGTGAGPLRPGEDGATRELAERLDDLVRSDQIAANVVSTLHLDESRASLLKRISVDVPEAGLLRIGVRDDNRLRAQQIAQEIGFLFPQLIERRFPRLNAPVWDPAHLVDRSERHWGRNLGIAAAISALFWLVLFGPHALRQAQVALEARPARAPAVVSPTPAGPAAPAPASLPPPQLAAPALEPEPPPRAEPEPEAVVEPQTEPEPEPAPTPTPTPTPAEPAPTPAPSPEPTEPEPQPELAAVTGDRGDWNFGDLERLVREQSADFPDRAEEWDIYLESIREYAAPDGQLPASLDWLIWDTFGDLLERHAK